VEPNFTEPLARPPLVLLRDTERLLRRKTVDTLAPLLPGEFATRMGEASLLAEDSLEKLAEIDLDAIHAAEMHPVRIKVGLTLVGFGALALVFLLLFLYALHPDLTPIEQVRHYWYQYICLVSIGVTGMFMLGREALRPPLEEGRSHEL
jgi:hypothetical protein